MQCLPNWAVVCLRCSKMQLHPSPRWVVHRNVPSPLWTWWPHQRWTADSADSPRVWAADDMHCDEARAGSRLDADWTAWTLPRPSPSEWCKCVCRLVDRIHLPHQAACEAQRSCGWTWMSIRLSKPATSSSMASPSWLSLRSIYWITWHVPIFAVLERRDSLAVRSIGPSWIGAIITAIRILHWLPSEWTAWVRITTLPDSISIVNSESKFALDSTYNATCAGLYAMYNTARVCGNETCGFCTQIKEQIEPMNGTLKIDLPQRTQDNYVFLFPSLRVITQFTFSRGPKKNWSRCASSAVGPF